MRDKETLLELGEISTLLQYLYIDENASITFNNGLTDLRITMSEELDVECQNLKFEEFPPTNWNSHMNPYEMVALIEILKEQPAEKFLLCKSKWEEIKTITSANLALN